MSTLPPPPFEALTQDGQLSKESWYRWFELTGTNMPSYGSFTPTLTTTGTDFASVTYDAVRNGSYCRIGNLILFWITMRTDAIDITGATGQVVVGGLPFPSALTVSQFIPVTVGFTNRWLGEHPIEALVPGGGDTVIRLYYRATSDAGSTASAVADVWDAANANEIYLSGHYITTT